MTVVRYIIAVAGLVAQVLFFVGLVFLLVDLNNLKYVMTPEMQEDSSLLVPYLRETLVSYYPVYGIGFIGAVVCYVVLYKKLIDRTWFVKSTRLLAWLWLPFVPVGTLVGIVLLGASKEAIEASTDTP